MKQVVIVQGDTNDADYVTKETVIDEPREIKLVRKVAKAINEFRPYTVKVKGRDWTHGHNFPFGSGEYVPRYDLGELSPADIYKDKLSHDEIEEFFEMVPFGESGIHSIKSIRIVKISDDKELIK